MESPKINPCISGQITIDKGVKPVQWEREQSLQQMVLGKLDIHTQNREAGHLPHTKYKN